MLSPFRGPGGEESGAGGKVNRKRRRAVPASPYARPENSLPPPVARGGNPKWFSGIFSGAGRLISSVFRSESDEEEEEEEDVGAADRLGYDEEGNSNDHIGDLQQLDEKYARGSQGEIQWNGRKLAIKQLLLQESFSREESDALIKIIRSRVVDTANDERLGEKKEVPERSVYSDPSFLGTWRSMNQGRNFPDGLTYSSNHMNELPLEASLIHGYTHDLCDKAVMEAKQWLDKKRMESASKSDRDIGPCTLNTDRWEDGDGSPVDIARSYMRSRPPWQSPILNGIGFRTPPSGLLLIKDETPSTVNADLLSPASQEPTRSLLFSDDPRPGSSLLLCLNHDESDPTAGIVPEALEASKPLDPPSTPENLSLDHDYADVASSSPGRGAVNVNISTPPPSFETAKPVDSSMEDGKTFTEEHSANGVVDDAETKRENVVNFVCSTNFTADAEDDVSEVDLKPQRPERSASPSLPNFILVNEEIVDFGVPLEAVKQSDNMSIVGPSGQSQQAVNGNSLQDSGSEPRVGAAEEGRHLPPPQNGGGVFGMTAEQKLSPARYPARSGRVRRVASKYRRGRGRGK